MKLIYLGPDDEEIKSLAHGYLFPHKIKVTLAREAILYALIDSAEPLTLSEISKKTKKHSTASVYRTLELFKKKGLIQLINIGEEVHYELLHGRKHHHHVICTNCGDFEDVDNCSVRTEEKEILSRSKKFSSLSHHSLEFFGVCQKCLK